MKKIAYAGLTALSVTALMAGVATAQTAVPTAAPPQGPAARHVRLDTDGDGKISQAEFVQARTARLTALDADRDGSLTVAEIHARMQVRQAEQATARFDRLDADKNGEISRAEFDARRTQRTEGAQPGRGERVGGHRQGGQRMALHGRRGHGPAEQMPDRGPVLIADVETHATANFVRLDADHDGFLSADEVFAARGDRAGRGPGFRGQGRIEQHRARHMSRPMGPAPTPASPPAPASE